MPPVHPLFGHILFLKELRSKIPVDVNENYLPDQIRRALPDLGPIYYIDAWPLMTPTLIVASPETLQQITQDPVLPKFPATREYMKPLTNGVDLVSMDGQQWKTWRGVFNPGFSSINLMNQVPGIVEETMVFCETLAKRVTRKYPWEVKILTDNLAMDVVGRVVL
jgi:cytochrome P450